jgi:hypothetical protein
LTFNDVLLNINAWEETTAGKIQLNEKLLYCARIIKFIASNIITLALKLG